MATTNVKKILIIFTIATPLILGFILLLNAMEPSAPSPEGCPFSLPEQGNLDLSLMRNDRTGEFIRKIQNNEGNVITGTTAAERVIQIAHIAVKCEVTLGSCGNTVKTISWLAGVPGPTRVETGEDAGKIDGEAGANIRDISPEQRHAICYINCGRSDCSKPCSDEVRAEPGYEKRITVYEKLKDEVRERGQTEKWPDLWANMLRPGDGIVVYNANSDPPGGHYAIFLGWDDEETGKAKVIQGAWGEIVEESFIYLKQAHGAHRPLIKITRP